MSDRAEVRGEIVKLDYSTLRDTVYLECKLIFEGGRPPILINCDFRNCEFIFEGAALNTQMFLTLLANSGAADLVVNSMLGLKDWTQKNG